MVRGTCHCGAVEVALLNTPEFLLECNCSVCRRYASQWAYGTSAQVTITTHKPNATIRYIHGKKKLAFHSCATCGCTTHWESLSPETDDRKAINCRLAEPKDLEGYPIRHFDGADSWQFLD